MWRIFMEKNNALPGRQGVFALPWKEGEGQGEMTGVGRRGTKLPRGNKG